MTGVGMRGRFRIKLFWWWHVLSQEINLDPIVAYKCSYINENLFKKKNNSKPSFFVCVRMCTRAYVWCTCTCLCGLMIVCEHTCVRVSVRLWCSLTYFNVCTLSKWSWKWQLNFIVLDAASRFATNFSFHNIGIHDWIFKLNSLYM